MEKDGESMFTPGVFDDAFLHDFLQPADLQLAELPHVAQDDTGNTLAVTTVLSQSRAPPDVKKPTRKAAKRKPSKRSEREHANSFNSDRWSQGAELDMDDMSDEGESPEELLSQGLIGIAEMHRLKNRAAQRRFRQRQKARMQTSASQVQELTAQMNQMLLRQQELEARNQVLEHTCTLATSHILDLNENMEAYDVQQEMILRDTARVYRRGLSRPDLSIEELKQQKAEFFIMEVFPAFLGRYRLLLETGGKTPGTPEAAEITETVMLRRQEENRVAAYSQWTLAIYAWNKEEMQRGVQYPGKVFWQQLLEALDLTPQQQLAFVTARRRLLTALGTIRQQREKLILALGIALLQMAPTGSTKEEKDLRANLEAERHAVMDFLFAVVDQTLTPIQEAQLDVACYPWCPDLWHFASLLAGSHEGEPVDTIRSERNDALAPAANMLPHHCSAETLCLPLLARGAGLQLKRGLASIVVPQDVMASAQRMKGITIAKMRDMTCWGIMRGDFFREENEQAPDICPAS